MTISPPPCSPPVFFFLFPRVMAAPRTLLHGAASDTPQVNYLGSFAAQRAAAVAEHQHAHAGAPLAAASPSTATPPTPAAKRTGSGGTVGEALGAPGPVAGPCSHGGAPGPVAGPCSHGGAPGPTGGGGSGGGGSGGSGSSGAGGGSGGSGLSLALGGLSSGGLPSVGALQQLMAQCLEQLPAQERAGTGPPAKPPNAPRSQDDPEFSLDVARLILGFFFFYARALARFF